MPNFEELHKQKLWEMKKKVLQTQYPMLCENIDPRRHYCYLRSKEILSCDDQERIDGGQTRKDRACRLIDMLLTKGPTAFDELCASIKEERTQIFLLENLHKALEKELDKWRQQNVVDSMEWPGSVPMSGEPYGPPIPQTVTDCLNDL